MYKNFIVIILLCLTTDAVAMMTINHKKYSVRIRPPKTQYITLHDAAQMGDIEKIEKILPYYDDIDIKNNSGETPLFVAIKHDKKDAAAMFLNLGANPNTLNNWGKTPLMETIKNKSLECTMLLLKKGANPRIGKPYPESLLVDFYAESPSDERVIENYKFLVPVHSKMLRMRLKPLHKQQQYKLYQSLFLAKLALQRYLHENNNTLIKDIIHKFIQKLLEESHA